MSGFRQSMITKSFLLALAGGAYAASDWLKGSTDEKLKALAAVQPGLGTVMIEYANRYSNIYYAAKAAIGLWLPISSRKRWKSRRWERRRGPKEPSP
jgi:hypothetical protein